MHLGGSRVRVHLRKIFIWFRQRARIFDVDFCRHLRDTARHATPVGKAIIAGITANVVLCSHEQSNVVQHKQDNNEANEVNRIEQVISLQRESPRINSRRTDPIEDARREDHHSGGAEASTARVTF